MDDALSLALSGWLENPSVMLCVRPDAEIERLRGLVEYYRDQAETLNRRYCEQLQINMQLRDELRKGGYRGKII